ncbi:hypothetical protein [Nocardia sp. NBC_01329]|uniref:hypothetical protein n=1 Tax=Nocardia sp. NBC_01329 TaxID=2903594 RepID=UPI002E10BB81|nr:hypothetical protein OG405_03680 [Nocardia sp. NBC_01329]
MTGKSVKLCAAMVFTGAAMAWSAAPASAADHVVGRRGVVVTVSGANSKVVHVRTPFGLLGSANYTYVGPDGLEQDGWIGAHFPVGLDATEVAPGRITQVSACVAQPGAYLQESFSGKPPGWTCSPGLAL